MSSPIPTNLVREKEVSSKHISSTYFTVIQHIKFFLQKKWQKTLVGIRKKPTFAPQFNAEERWVSGWNQQFAKLSYPAMGTGGSNPPFSAKERRRWQIVFFFGVWRSPASAPALGAGGRRFESFCPDKLKTRELRRLVTPSFFGKNWNLPMICPWDLKYRYKFAHRLFIFSAYLQRFRERTTRQNHPYFEGFLGYLPKICPWKQFK